METFARFPDGIPLRVAHRGPTTLYLNRSGGTTKDPAKARVFPDKSTAAPHAARWWATFAGGCVYAEAME